MSYTNPYYNYSYQYPNPMQGAQNTQMNQINSIPTQQMFPSPQGSVYQINNTLEVANVPTGAGLSVALCMNEGLMYIKSMQNGNPMFWAYRLIPYTEEKNSLLKFLNI